jgi:hypothetical protein
MVFRTFELNVSAAGEMTPPAELADKLAEVLPFMHSLHTFRLLNSLYYGPWPSLLQAILSSPSLTTLEICDSPWRKSTETFTEKTLNLPTATLNLRKFIYRVPFTDCFPRISLSHGRRDEIQGQVEILNLIALLSQFNTCLEYLELPSEIAPFLFEQLEDPLAQAQVRIFPNLRKMRVEGHIPLILPRWRGLFSCAPQLKGVEFKVARTQVEPRYRAKVGGEWGYCLLPEADLGSSRSGSFPMSEGLESTFTTNRDEGHDADRTREDLEQSAIARLRSLHISSPCAKDGVFRHVSDSLTELSLVAYPLPGILGARWSDAPASELRTAKQMLDVLELLCLPNLMRFRMAYSADGSSHDDTSPGTDQDQGLVARIGQSFPELEELEIHRYRGTGVAVVDPVVSDK